MTQMHMDDILEPGSRVHTRPEGDTQMVEALASSIVRTRGILFNALVSLEQRPKPWPNKDKALRLKIAKCVGILLTAWEGLDDGTRKKVLRATPKD